MRRTACFLVAVAFTGLSQFATADVYGPPAPPAFEDGYTSFDNAGLRSEINSTRKRIENGMVSGYDDAPKAGAAKAVQGNSDGCGCGCASDCGCGCADGCGCCGCQSCCCCCDPCCRDAGFIFSAELSWMKPHHGGGIGGVANTGAQVDPDFEETLRVVAGWQRCDGLGWRVRYWEFDHSDVQTTNNVTSFYTIDTYYIDLEIIDSTKLGCAWDATFGAGFRYVDHQEGAGRTNFNNVAFKGFNGIGTTASLELRRAVTCNVGVYVGARWSIIYGDEDNATRNGGGTVVVEELDNIKYMYELSAGTEYKRQMGCTSYFFLRSGVDVQVWDDFGVDNVNFARVDYPLGFGGYTLAVGINR